MNYTVNGRFYVANEGYVFHSTLTGINSKRVALPKPELLELYEVIVEPVVEEPEVDENAATEADYINALEELGVNFNE